MADRAVIDEAGIRVTYRDMGDGTWAEVVYVGGSGASADTELGAVEIKNDSDDTRAKIGAGVKGNALRVVLASDEALAAGTNEIGKINWRHFNVLGSLLTRPANQTPYSIGDSISNDATVGNVIAQSSNDLSDINDNPINLTEILLDSNDSGPGNAGALIRIHLFNSNPTANSGVQGGDNAAWANKSAGWFGSFSGLMRVFYDGSKGVLIPDEGTSRIAFPASGARNIWYQLQTLTAFTPGINSSTFTPRFKGLQGRL